MQRYAATLCALLLMVFMSGCGGSSTTAANTPVYDVPSNLAQPNGNMGGAVQGNTFVAKFSNYSVSTFAGTAGVAGSTDTDKVATTGKPVSFNQPVGMATDGTYIYVSDYNNNMIRRIDLSNNTVKRLAGSSIGAAGYADSTDQTGDTATFNAPTAITVFGNYLYVADTGNNMIRRVDKSTGVVTIVAGSTTGVAGAVDSKTVPTDARFNQPTGITTDGENLYVTDYGNHTIRRIVIASKAVTTLAGSPGAAGSDDGAQSIARFNQPARITTDRTYLYVTDTINRTIRRIEISSGNVKTIAGIPGPLDSAGNIADSTDGTGATARFNQPNGITTDGSNLFVTDSFNNSIRMIATPQGTNSSGPVTTIISGTSAQFVTPIGITTDGTALFVADSNSHTIRKIE